MTQRQERVEDLLQSLAAEYISRESDRTSMITVIHTDVSRDLKKSTVYVTVYPIESEAAALLFLKRHRGEFRKYVKKRTRLKQLPFFDFVIDEGEKNRQRIEEIT